MIFQPFCFDLQIFNACHLIVDYILYREVIGWNIVDKILKVSVSSLTGIGKLEFGNVIG